MTRPGLILVLGVAVFAGFVVGGIVLGNVLLGEDDAELTPVALLEGLEVTPVGESGDTPGGQFLPLADPEGEAIAAGGGTGAGGSGGG